MNAVLVYKTVATIASTILVAIHVTDIIEAFFFLLKEH